MLLALPKLVYSYQEYKIEEAQSLHSQIRKDLFAAKYDSALFRCYELLTFSKKHSLPLFECKSYYEFSNYFYLQGQKDSTLFYLKKAEGLFDLVQDNLVKGKILAFKGHLLKTKGDTENALFAYSKAKELLYAAKDTLWWGLVNNHIGFIYFRQGSYFVALQNMHTAIDAFKKMNHHENLGTLYNTMGLIYRKTNNKLKEEEAYLNAISVLENEEVSITRGMAHNNLAEVYFDNGEESKGFASLEKAKQIFIDTDYQVGLCGYYAVLSYYYSHIEPVDHIKVIDNARKGLSIAERYNDLRHFADASNFLGRAYLETNELRKAEKTLLKGLEVAKSDNLTPEIINLSEALAQLYDQMRKPKLAFEFLNEYLVLKDSISGEARVKEFTSLDLSYKFKQTQLQDSLTQVRKEESLNFIHRHELQEQRQYKLSLFFLSILLIIVVVFVYNNSRKNKRIAAVLSEKNKLINQSLKEKKLLLREVHHRVKNNFQLVSSLLELQSRELKDIEFQKTISEGQNRVKAMALIHQKLYQNEELSTINFRDYCSQLVNEVKGMYAGFMNIEVELDINEIYFDIDTAIPLGLILNELITNAFKYAFQEGKENLLSLSLINENKDGYALLVRDNGHGLPGNIDVKMEQSLGLRLVRRLSKQLHGSFNYIFDSGSVFTINFKDTHQRRETD